MSSEPLVEFLSLTNCSCTELAESILRTYAYDLNTALNAYWSADNEHELRAMYVESDSPRPLPMAYENPQILPDQQRVERLMSSEFIPTPRAAPATPVAIPTATPSVHAEVAGFDAMPPLSLAEAPVATPAAPTTRSRKRSFWGRLGSLFNCRSSTATPPPPDEEEAPRPRPQQRPLTLESGRAEAQHFRALVARELRSAISVRPAPSPEIRPLPSDTSGSSGGEPAAIPPFYDGSYTDALAAARAADVPLVVYLHQAGQAQALHTLAAEPLAGWLRSGAVVVWGGDVAGNEGSHLARAVHAHSYPFLALIVANEAPTPAAGSSPVGSGPVVSGSMIFVSQGRNRTASAFYDEMSDVAARWVASVAEKRERAREAAQRAALMAAQAQELAAAEQRDAELLAEARRREGAAEARTPRLSDAELRARVRAELALDAGSGDASPASPAADEPQSQSQPQSQPQKEEEAASIVDALAAWRAAWPEAVAALHARADAALREPPCREERKGEPVEMTVAVRLPGNARYQARVAVDTPVWALLLHAVTHASAHGACPAVKEVLTVEAGESTPESLKELQTMLTEAQRCPHIALPRAQLVTQMPRQALSNEKCLGDYSLGSRAMLVCEIACGDDTTQLYAQYLAK